jgi:hypothetical protein
MQPADPDDRAIELRLTVWPCGRTGWHARLVAADASEREFASPFDLARYLAWPGLLPWRDDGRGLR